MAAHIELARRLDELEAGVAKRLATHDRAIADILAAIRNLMAPGQPARRPIGFVTTSGDKK
jgi:antitoxin (DNA-binding transcriptional repressor) of toxin-antitoxin stability system